ncbi:Na(+)/H(+) antiporter NhaA [BD1-7 clade bacterium]|uniref:Na(+)/H(+) antiporter NhaA n=1 Tax=BD1-7 clade bacterium TaxID=2029982 RepID=A0A5S9N999_9GAMM|nr:Na(+)/H(+) antiporter NhaA [BD1-7 clade bacterium]
MIKKKAFSLAGFFKGEAAGGILLMLATLLALIVANSPAAYLYDWFINLHLSVGVFEDDFLFEIDKPLLLWINDGLMVAFFLVVGLELKREIVEGELSEPKKVVLPALGAIGGMAAPALVYVYFNWGNPDGIRGWAIPAATDIAFALGLLSLLGPRVPVSLKIFLTSLAIFDDIGAIVIIAVFYTAKISLVSLGVCAVCIAILYMMNRMNVEDRPIYFLVGIIMWVAMLKSGVHATLTGVILAMFIPMHSRKRPGESPLKELEHELHAAVAYVALPIFAFANAGINLSGVGIAQVVDDVPLGIILGLFIGKQVGIFALCWLGIKSGLAAMPAGMNWKTLYGISILCGVGFTMSLFIGGLAFEELGLDKPFDERLGIILGSLLSGTVGLAVLHFLLPKEPAPVLAH